MKAQPDDRTFTGTLAFTRPWFAGIAFWSVYTGALTVLHVVARNRADHASEQATAWALSIVVTVAVLVLPTRLTAEAAEQARHRAPTVPNVVWVAALAGSVALIGVAASLIAAGEPAGAWILTLPAVAAPLHLLFDRVRPVWAPTGRHDAARPAADGHPADRAGAADDPAAESDDRAEAECEAGDPRPLLLPGWREKLAQDGPAVALEAGFWAAARKHLRPDADEQGGVALMVRTEATRLVLGMVFPTQVRANSVRCEFSAHEVDRVRRAINSVADELGLAPGTVMVTWVHTHPRLGVFLSSTDVATSATWRALDPAFTPIVIDISCSRLEDQIGVFDADGRKLLPIAPVDGLVSPTAGRRLAEAVDRLYRGDGVASPLVLLNGLREPAEGATRAGHH